MGFTKMLATTKSFSRRARSSSTACPRCKAPIVGTSPIDFPRGRRARSAAIPPITSGIGKLPRPHFFRERSHGIGDRLFEIGVLLRERRFARAAEPENVVRHQD